MEGFTYTNIFDTKGIEYIIIIFFFLILIPFWMIMNKSQVKKQIQVIVKALTAGALRIPKGLFYSKNHTWAFIEKSGNAKIGIDDFLLHIVGAIQLNMVKKEGDKISKGEVLAEIEQHGKRLQLFAPVSGIIVSANSMLEENAEIMKADPYGKGWMYAVQPSNWKAETSGFYFAEEAVKWIGSELQRFKDFLNVTLSKNNETSMLVYQEGGELQMNPLEGLKAEIWDDFQKEFLDKTA
ncbi:MAG: glycine cleavage system protein H [Draconibacterium sp.]